MFAGERMRQLWSEKNTEEVQEWEVSDWAYKWLGEWMSKIETKKRVSEWESKWLKE